MTDQDYLNPIAGRIQRSPVAVFIPGSYRVVCSFPRNHQCCQGTPQVVRAFYIAPVRDYPVSDIKFSEVSTEAQMTHLIVC
jgi:hypothetical protein